MILQELIWEIDGNRMEILEDIDMKISWKSWANDVQSFWGWGFPWEFHDFVREAGPLGRPSHRWQPWALGALGAPVALGAELDQAGRTGVEPVLGWAGFYGDYLMCSFGMLIMLILCVYLSRL